MNIYILLVIVVVFVVVFLVIFLVVLVFIVVIICPRQRLNDLGILQIVKVITQNERMTDTDRTLQLIDSINQKSGQVEMDMNGTYQ